MIGSGAATLLRLSISTPNEPAESLGLGPCQIFERPGHGCTYSLRKKLARDSLGRETKSSKTCRAYHITWIGEYGPAPSTPSGELCEYSHRCHRNSCVNPRHGVWEDHPSNIARERCEKFGSHLPVANRLAPLCNHGEQICVTPKLADMDHPSLTRRTLAPAP